MAEYGSTWEREDLGGGQFRHIQHMKPVAFFRDGLYRPMNTDYASDGLGGHIITDSPLMVSIGDDANGRATRRIHPTRESDVWAEIGRPYNVTTRQPYPLNAFTRSGNLLTSTNNLADVMIWHGGHFSKLGIELKGAWRTAPPEQFAFPVALNGLTWSDGGILRKDGIPVMHLSAPEMYDRSNPELRRAIPWDFVQVAGQWYVVFDTPSTAGMSRPLIDPTLSLQPDGTDGVDNIIIQSQPTTNVGTSAFFTVGERNDITQNSRGLIKFDLSSLPGAALITSATFSLFATTDLSSNARTFRVFRLKREWGETTSTWNTYDGTNSWATAGAFGVNDCEQTEIGSRAFTATETLNEFKDFSLTPTTKTGLDWGLEQGGSQTGWLVKVDTETNDAYSFSSSDAATAANRPKLVIVYTEASGALLKRMMYHAARRRSS